MEFDLSELGNDQEYYDAYVNVIFDHLMDACEL
jgi:hypothetical protein